MFVTLVSLKSGFQKQYCNWTPIYVYVCVSYICLATQIHTCRRRERSGGREEKREKMNRRK